MPARRFDLARTFVTFSITAALLLASVWVLSPFLLAITWATMIVVASWPLLLMLERRFRGRRWLAVCVLIAGLLMLIFLPFVLAASTLIDHSAQLIQLAASLKSLAVPEAPAWLAGLPYVGTKAAQWWADGAALGLQELAGKAAPYAGNMTRWFATKIGHIGLLLVQIALAIVISAILYVHGEQAAAVFRRFAQKIGGQQGENMVLLAAGAIRGVALGVGVTALVQAVLGGIGLALTGVPFIAVLTALMFMLCIAQIGVLPVLAPAIIWLYWSEQAWWGSFLLVWMIVVVNLDNFLRPWLIKRGADLPLLLILAGVIGGIISFGLLGIFLGPLLLAVSYTLLAFWLNEDERTAASGLDSPVLSEARADE